MNVILLAVLALHGAPGDGSGMQGGYGAGDYGAYGECEMCDEGCRHCGRHGDDGGCPCLGPMPQSCYMPSYGCYSNSRFMHRYPAFHGTYYRKAYNYRNYFDYPWHAGLHEPTSLFSYHVPAEQPADLGPAPVPDAARINPDHTYRAAQIPAPVYDAPAPTPALRTLRR